MWALLINFEILQMTIAQWISMMGLGSKENGIHITVSCTTSTQGTLKF